MTDRSISGCILGGAVGDAIGLPYEGLSRQRAVKLLGPPERHRFLFGRGMVSDDTEHTCMVVQSLIAAGGDLDAFRRRFAWRLRWWLAGVPAGIGLATLRACVRLWLGFPPERSGVESAGNGPAMRAAILGVVIEDRLRLREWVRAASRMTHTDPKAELGAFAVALAARVAADGDAPAANFRKALEGELANDDADELLELVERAASSAAKGESTDVFASSIGCERGVSGYVYHSVPVVLHAWFSHPSDYRLAVASVIHCGGDADTTAAMVGGIVGAGVGVEGIPDSWLAAMVDWPRSVSWMSSLAEQLERSVAANEAARPIELPIWGHAPRNLLFLITVLYHGFRRLFPPYSTRPAAR